VNKCSDCSYYVLLPENPDWHGKCVVPVPWFLEDMDKELNGDLIDGVKTCQLFLGKPTSEPQKPVEQKTSVMQIRINK
jgi:hypothetical protein